MKDRATLIQALKEYGHAIQRDGWRAGESIIVRYELVVPDFRRWAYALGIMLRAEELLAAGA